MKNLKFFTAVVSCIFLTNLNAQVKVHSSGGITVGTTNYYNKKFDVYGGVNRFYYSYNKPLEFVLLCQDPRLSSNYRVVFYKLDGSGFIDIECKKVYEYSDITKKTNLTRLENSMEKILTLNGYSYNLIGDQKGKKYSGLIAQQIEKVIPEAIETNDSTGEKLVSYSTIIPYLVEAIKEQQKTIEEFETKITDINSKLKSYSNSDIKNSNGLLEQNNPNPFTSDTEIKYFIPTGTSSATLYVFNMQGSMIINHPIEDTGEGLFKINGSQLTPGMYMYTLVLDGNEVDTKRMILTD